MLDTVITDYAKLIIKTVADVYEIPLSKLLVISKKRELVEARQMVMYIMHKEGFQGKTIAEHLNRSRCIVARNKLKIADEMPFYKDTKLKYDTIMKLIKNKQ